MADNVFHSYYRRRNSNNDGWDLFYLKTTGADVLDATSNGKFRGVIKEEVHTVNGKKFTSSSGIVLTAADLTIDGTTTDTIESKITELETFKTTTVPSTYAKKSGDTFTGEVTFQENLTISKWAIINNGITNSSGSIALTFDNGKILYTNGSELATISDVDLKLDKTGGTITGDLTVNGVTKVAEIELDKTKFKQSSIDTRNGSYTLTFPEKSGTIVVNTDIADFATKDSVQTAQNRADEAYSLAEGRTRSVSFPTIDAMITALKSASKTDYKIGDNIFIEAVNVPDYWISKVLDDNSGIYGYFEVSILETQKVSLNDYVDLNSAQTIGGEKTFSDKIKINGGLEVKPGGYILTDGDASLQFSTDGNSLYFEGTSFEFSDASNVTIHKLKDSNESLGTNGQVLLSNGTYIYWGDVSTTDTKNTAGSTDTSGKIYLIGTTAQSEYSQTYSHDTVYIGADGCLYSNNEKTVTIDSKNEINLDSVDVYFDEVNSSLIDTDSILIGDDYITINAKSTEYTATFQKKNGTVAYISDIFNVYTGKTDPSSISGNTVKAGDFWLSE